MHNQISLLLLVIITVASATFGDNDDQFGLTDEEHDGFDEDGRFHGYGMGMHNNRLRKKRSLNNLNDDDHMWYDNKRMFRTGKRYAYSPDNFSGSFLTKRVGDAHEKKWSDQDAAFLIKRAIKQFRTFSMDEKKKRDFALKPFKTMKRPYDLSDFSGSFLTKKRGLAWMDHVNGGTQDWVRG